jgi:hypothetical protein
MSDNPVPWLRKGVGETPAYGGCILQVIDWIDRGKWTDQPECVHPVLAAVAIELNDRLDDRGRQRLLDLAPRLMGTASDDPMLTTRLACFAARRVLHLFERDFPGDGRPRAAIEATEAWCDNPCEETDATRDAAGAAASAAAGALARDAATDAARAAAGAAAGAAAAGRFAGAAAGLDLLVTLLDEHDRLTGRDQEQPAVDWAPVVEVMGAA